MNKNQNNYNKWVGVLLSFFFGGLGQYLYGRKLRGIYWHCGLLLVFLFIQLSLIFPVFDWIYVEIFLLCIYIILWFIMLFDSYKPIKKLSFLKWLILLLIIIAINITESIFFNVIDFGKSSTGSMEPTIISQSCTNKIYKDRFVIDSICYKFRKPHRGEIIVFETTNIDTVKYPIKNKKYVKRIVGLPGEKVCIKPPYIFINDKKLISPPIFKKISECNGKYKGYFLPVLYIDSSIIKNENVVIFLKNDEYFVLGDNSKYSLDSRYFGPIKRESIISRATKIIWPPSRIRNLE